jgi:hypothetical protein
MTNPQVQRWFGSKFDELHPMLQHLHLQGGQLAGVVDHHADGMHWDRCFDGTRYFRSLFCPIGTWQNGYWLEDTGPLQMRLTVDIKEGGWYWRCLEMRVFGWRLPLWLFPNSKAFKTVEDDRYRFYVGFSLPYLGTILSYNGSLSLIAAMDGRQSYNPQK